MLKSILQRLNFLIEIDFISAFFLMVSPYRNWFINLTCEFINWFLYGKIVDGYDIYLILTVENYVFRVPNFCKCVERRRLNNTNLWVS